MGKDFAIVRGHLIGIFGARFGNREIEGQRMIGLEAEIDVGEVPEAVDGEAGARQESKRQGEFADYENPTERRLPAPVPARPPSLRLSAGSHARRTIPPLTSCVRG